MLVPYLREALGPVNQSMQTLVENTEQENSCTLDDATLGLAILEIHSERSQLQPGPCYAWRSPLQEKMIAPVVWCDSHSTPTIVAERHDMRNAKIVYTVRVSTAKFELLCSSCSFAQVEHPTIALFRFPCKVPLLRLWVLHRLQWWRRLSV